MKDLFVLIGIVCTIMICVFAFWLAFEYVRDTFSKAIWTYKYKHRFEKKPVAECYCRDCTFRSSYNNKCTKFIKDWVPDDFFCKHAYPHKKDPELKEKDNA